MTRDAPVFATQAGESNAPKGGLLIKRYVIGVVCSMVSLAVLAIVCYMLETAKMTLREDGYGVRGETIPRASRNK